MLTTKNQPSHRNGVSQNALLGNCMYFIFRQMTFLRQNFAENRKEGDLADKIKRDRIQCRSLYNCVNVRKLFDAFTV